MFTKYILARRLRKAHARATAYRRQRGNHWDVRMQIILDNIEMNAFNAYATHIDPNALTRAF